MIKHPYPYTHLARSQSSWPSNRSMAQAGSIVQIGNPRYVCNPLPPTRVPCLTHKRTFYSIGPGTGTSAPTTRRRTCTPGPRQTRLANRPPQTGLAQERRPKIAISYTRPTTRTPKARSGLVDLETYVCFCEFYLFIYLSYMR